MDSYPSTSKSPSIIYIQEDVINEDTKTGGKVEDSKEMDIMEDVKDENMATSETCSLDFHRYFEKANLLEDSRSNIDSKDCIEKEEINQFIENAREEITRQEHNEEYFRENDFQSITPKESVEKMKEDSMQAYLDIDDRIPKNEINPIYTSLDIMAKEMDMEVETKNNAFQSFEDAFGKNIEPESEMASAKEVEEENASPEKKRLANAIENIIATANKKKIAAIKKLACTKEKKSAFTREKSIPKETMIAEEENQSIRKPIVWDVMDDKLNKKLKKHSRIDGVVAFAFHSNPFKTVRNFSLATFHESVIREPCDNEDWLEKLNYFIKKLKITHLYVQGARQSFYLRQKLNAFVLRLEKRNLMLTCPVCFRKSCSVFKIQNFFKSHFGYSIPVACNDRY